MMFDFDAIEAEEARRAAAGLVEDQVGAKKEAESAQQENQKRAEQPNQQQKQEQRHRSEREPQQQHNQQDEQQYHFYTRVREPPFARRPPPKPVPLYDETNDYHCHLRQQRLEAQQMGFDASWCVDDKKIQSMLASVKVRDSSISRVEVIFKGGLVEHA